MVGAFIITQLIVAGLGLHVVLLVSFATSKTTSLRNMQTEPARILLGK